MSAPFITDITSSLNSEPLSDLSVVIPCAPSDTPHPSIIAAALRTKVKAIVVSIGENCVAPLLPETLVVSGRSGRAEQLNRGLDAVNTKYVLFLHADSVIEPDFLRAAATSLSIDPDSLWHGTLRFNSQGIFGAMMRLNAIGAQIRSRVFKLPFGDQGFAVATTVVRRLGGFPLGQRRGEDLLFIRRCHKAGVPIRRLRARILSSARRYEEHGWLMTTLHHFKETVRLWRREV